MRGSRILSGMLFMVSVGNFKDQMFGKSRLAVAAKINLITLTDQDKMIFFAAEGVIGFVDLIDSDEVKTFAFQFIARIGNGLIRLRGKADREWGLWALRDPRQDVGVANKFKHDGFRILLDFRRRCLSRTVVCNGGDADKAVSYTHLTLPTNREV